MIGVVLGVVKSCNVMAPNSNIIFNSYYKKAAIILEFQCNNNRIDFSARIIRISTSIRFRLCQLQSVI